MLSVEFERYKTIYTMVCRSALRTVKPISHLRIHTLIVKGEKVTACVLQDRRGATGYQSHTLSYQSLLSTGQGSGGWAELGAPRCGAPSS